MADALNRGLRPGFQRLLVQTFIIIIIIIIMWRMACATRDLWLPSQLKLVLIAPTHEHVETVAHTSTNRIQRRAT